MGEFDGIKEREEGKKKMPFAITILFSVLVLIGLTYIYLFTPHITGWTQTAQYESKMNAYQALSPTKQKEAKGTGTEAHASMEALARGEKIYKENCAMCHGDNLQGVVGPSLMGPKFKYGASLEDHIRVISKGTSNGMPGFESQLGTGKVNDVANYIHAHHKH